MLLIASPIIGFITALIAVVGLFLALKMASKSKDGLLNYYFYAILLSNGLLIVLTERSFEENVLFSTSGGHWFSAWAIRFSSVFIMLAALERIVNFFSYHSLNKQRTILILVLVYFWLTSVFIPTFITSSISLSHQYFYSLVFFIAIALNTQENPIKTIYHAKTALVAMVVASFLLIFIKPHHVMDFYYTQGYIAGLPRLYGATPHATVLASLAAIATWLLMIFPYQSKKLNTVLIALCVTALLLTQAKTTIGAFFIGVFIILLYLEPKNKSQGSLTSKISFSKLFITLTFVIGFATIVFITVFLIIAQTYNFSAIGQSFDSETIQKLTSFTGRDVLWEIALNEFYKSPIVGYGMDLFNADYVKQIGIPGAVHAHNQVIDTMGRAGLIGLSGLLLIYAYLLYYSIKMAKQSKGLSLALFLFLALKSTTEIPLNSTTVSFINIPFFMLLIIIASFFKDETKKFVSLSTFKHTAFNPRAIP